MDIWVPIVIAAVAGAVASWIVPGRTPGGLVGAIALGLVASVVGGCVYSLFFGAGPSSALGAFTISFTPAVVILYLLRAIQSSQPEEPATDLQHPELRRSAHGSPEREPVGVTPTPAATSAEASLAASVPTVSEDRRGQLG